MTLTSSEIIMLSTPVVGALMAGASACGVYFSVMRRRKNLPPKTFSTGIDDVVPGGTALGTQGNVSVQLTEAESRVVRRMLVEKR